MELKNIAKAIWSFSPREWKIMFWEQGSTEENTCPIKKSTCPDEEALTKYLASDRKLQLLPEADYETIMQPIRPQLHEQAKKKFVAWQEQEAAQKAALAVPDAALVERIFAIEQPIIAAFKVAPFDRKPTLVEALERGCALCPRITGTPVRALRKEDDGAYSASLLGALYVGCVGLDGIDEALLDANVLAWNESAQAMLGILHDSIFLWQKKDGSYRNVGQRYQRYLSDPGNDQDHYDTVFHPFYDWLRGVAKLREGADVRQHENLLGQRLIYRDSLSEMDAWLVYNQKVGQAVYEQALLSQ